MLTTSPNETYFCDLTLSDSVTNGAPNEKKTKESKDDEVQILSGNSGDNLNCSFSSIDKIDEDKTFRINLKQSESLNAS